MPPASSTVFARLARSEDSGSEARPPAAAIRCLCRRADAATLPGRRPAVSHRDHVGRGRAKRRDHRILADQAVRDVDVDVRARGDGGQPLAAAARQFQKPRVDGDGLDAADPKRHGWLRNAPIRDAHLTQPGAVFLAQQIGAVMKFMAQLERNALRALRVDDGAVLRIDQILPQPHLVVRRGR